MEQKPDEQKTVPTPMRKQRPEGYSPIMHRVDFSLDATPHEIAEALCRYADNLKMPVVMNYYGTDIQVLPGESVGQVEARMEVEVGTPPQSVVIGRQVRHVDPMPQPNVVQPDVVLSERLPRAGTHPLQPGEEQTYEPGKIATGMEEKMGQPGYTMGPSIQGPEAGITPTPEEHVQAAALKKEPPASPPAPQPVKPKV